MTSNSLPIPKTAPLPYGTCHCFWWVFWTLLLFHTWKRMTKIGHWMLQQSSKVYDIQIPDSRAILGYLQPKFRHFDLNTEGFNTGDSLQILFPKFAKSINSKIWKYISIMYRGCSSQSIGWHSTFRYCFSQSWHLPAASYWRDSWSKWCPRFSEIPIKQKGRPGWKWFWIFIARFKPFQQRRFTQKRHESAHRVSWTSRRLFRWILAL